MYRSSESIGAIAAALAKAQADLTNPEKSLIGIIGPSTSREPGRAFRYAPLSSGLEIVRKSLGRHAIAIVQSTAIDQEAGLVRLNTVLAHASGEWVASEWPVCRIADMASPQRMGAALTYARRYALFTLVGIAGEDDLDAPDLGVAQDPEPGSPPEPNGQSDPKGHVATGRANSPRGGKRPATPKQLLQPDASGVLREQLLIELAAIATADEAAMWAKQKLPAKNTLTPADADVIEQTFRAKLDSLGGMGTAEVASPAAGDGQRDSSDAQSGPNSPELDAGLLPNNNTILTSDAPKLAPVEEDQGAAALMKPVRKRDRAHRDFVCSQPCLICGRRPSDAHHIRFGQPRALGRKVSDEFIVPLCRVHHRDLHRRSDERAWWKAANIEPMEVAQRLWGEARDKSA
jgi:ERF superfamily